MTGGNKNYQKGVRKERKIVNEARANGLLSFRSAGSHSPIDVCTIDMENLKIRFIQVKPDNYKGEELEKKYQKLNGIFAVTFEVR